MDIDIHNIIVSCMFFSVFIGSFVFHIENPCSAGKKRRSAKRSKKGGKRRASRRRRRKSKKGGDDA